MTDKRNSPAAWGGGTGWNNSLGRANDPKLARFSLKGTVRGWRVGNLRLEAGTDWNDFLTEVQP
ncbi:hypothetical protein [Aliiruegeria lutimaris]|uniref:Uncharacterized protein n=1 Tax=Aliiruegeria lutimaris TaxID=571298 RepID=A0A1G8QBP7_9RHOB|nr:hypothetical protein [Aliiruegeria lutimaris]SDJ02229.1 hypothetical protein SAMN04488026_101098 [Aliiruegeria lutimaris]